MAVNSIYEYTMDTTIDNKLRELFDYLSQKSEVDVIGKIKLNNGNEAFRQKAYNYFEPKAILHDVWVIHFTNLEGFEDIPENGFKYGESDIEKLAYTEGNGWKENKGEYGFALLLDDPYIDNYDLGYGDCALIFKTDGVLAYHKIDRDDELIFINSNIKSNYYQLIFDDDEGIWYIGDNPCGTLRDAVNIIKKRIMTESKTNKNMKKNTIKLNESQLRKIVSESVKKVLKEFDEEWFVFTILKDDGTQVLRMGNDRDEWNYWRKNGGENYGMYKSRQEAEKAMGYFGRDYTKFKPVHGEFVKITN